MTAFTTADLPASITTVEQLAVWAGSILAEVNPSLTAIEGPGSSVRAAAANSFFIPEGPPEPEYRYIVSAVGWVDARKPNNPPLNGHAIGNANGLMLGIAALDPVMETQQQICK